MENGFAALFFSRSGVQLKWEDCSVSHFSAAKAGTGNRTLARTPLPPIREKSIAV
jgi:hypothetical protein